jgi:hypothetical protein
MNVLMFGDVRKRVTSMQREVRKAKPWPFLHKSKNFKESFDSTIPAEACVKPRRLLAGAGGVLRGLRKLGFCCGTKVHQNCE